MRIVMDGAGDVPPAMVEDLGIVVVPINIMFGVEEFRTGINMSHADFYEKVESVGPDNFPKTSQPTPYQFKEVYRQLLDQGEEEILTITVSERLSGTYASAAAALRELEEEGYEQLYLFDSKGGSAGQGWMAVEAARMVRDGAGIEAILERLAQMREDLSLYFLIDNLEYAVRGGRVSSFRSAVAGLLSIKPIMTLQDGLIVEGGRVRTYRRALQFIVDAVHQDVGDRPVKIATVHSKNKEAGEALRELARRRLTVVEDFLIDMAISVAINLGPGAVGLVAIPEQARHPGGGNGA